MNDRELITGLDACRAASDDLHQPELRAVAESIASDARAAEIRVRIERIDAATFRAMHNISLTVGLEGRLIAGLREAHLGAAMGDHLGKDGTSPTGVGSYRTISTPSRGGSSLSRRRWLAWSTGVATAVAATIAAVMFFRPVPPLEGQDLEGGRDWHNQIVASGDWQTMTSQERGEHLLPNELRGTPRHYRDASSIVGREAYAYDLSLPGGGLQATLFVIPQAARAGLPASPPPRPSSTLGLSIAYWQRGDVIYVVVINSDRIDDYRRLISTTPPAAA